MPAEEANVFMRHRAQPLGFLRVLDPVTSGTALQGIGNDLGKMIEVTGLA